MSEVAQAFAWINSTMRADSALMAAAVGGVWQGLADIGVVAPYATYAQQANSDVLTMNKVRLWASLLIQIKAVGSVKNYDALVIIADRIDALFKSVRPTALPGSGGVLECYRDGSIALDDPQPVNGVQWTSLGGLYRIDLQGS
jgi:hypothetical protein